MSTYERGPVRDRPPVSVAMATYNGAAHVDEQIDTILAQLGPLDEVVVVDDASTDDTRGGARSRSPVSPASGAGQPRLRGDVRVGDGAACGDDVLLRRPGRRVAGRARTRWSRALDGATSLRRTSCCSVGTAAPITGRRRRWLLRSTDSERHLANVVGVLAGSRPYYGCAMGLRSAALAVVLPFPAWLDESHDLWLALHGNLAGSMRTSTDRRSTPGPRDQRDSRPAAGRAPAVRSRVMLVRGWSSCVAVSARPIGRSRHQVGLSGEDVRPGC